MSSSSEDDRNLPSEYYAAQGEITSPRRYEYLFDGVPSSISGLVGVVQGLMIHALHAHRLGQVLSEIRKKETNLRKVERILRRAQELDERPVRYSRDPEKRVVGNCRDFAVLLCSLLRSQGIPARARCGFAVYFNPPGREPWYEDHWICEYRDSQRWARVDPQLDTPQKEAFHIDFDSLDMPPGKFFPAGEVWQLCREEKLDPSRCGIFKMRGLWFVRDNTIRDLMALNKLELLPWDCNGLMQGRNPPDREQYALLDRVAELTTADDSSLAEVRSLYESNPALRMPINWKP